MQFSRAYSNCFSFTTCYLLLFLLLSGCAQKRWEDPFTEDENSAMQSLLRDMQQQEQQCFKSYDADITLHWQSPAGDNAVAGYLRLLSPSLIKYIVSNPLGQPVFALAADGKSFQMLKPTERLHIRGNVRSLAIRNKIPLLLAQGDWFAYIAGRLPTRQLIVEESAKDTTDNSVWLKLRTLKGKYTTGSIYLQIEPGKRKLLSYLFVDDDEEVLAEIRYGNKLEGKTPCAVPTEIQISKLPWGTSVGIKLENISGFNQFSSVGFALPVPKGFNTQLWP